MKENTYRSSKIIIFSLMVVAIVAVFAVVIALTWGRDMPTGADTEKIDIDDTSNDTETEPLDIITDIVSDTGDIDTQPPPPTDENEKKQAQLDKCVDEISLWINDAVPRYEKAEETDVEGNVIVPAELYSPPVAFFYQDLYSGCTMEYNADRVFYTASIIKEPYVMWALCEIEKAEYEGVTEGTKFDLGSTFIYTEDKFKSGSGIIQKSEFGTEYSYYDLLRLAITQSDNVAFAELRNIYGRKGFNEFSAELGVSSTIKSLYRASAREMGVYLNKTFDFFQSGTKYSKDLKSWMLSTNHRIMIPSAVTPKKAANKYGWDLEAYHDMAIVFGEKPYLLVVMTELDKGSRADNAFIRDLVKKIDNAHSMIICAEE